MAYPLSQSTQDAIKRAQALIGYTPPATPAPYSSYDWDTGYTSAQLSPQNPYKTTTGLPSGAPKTSLLDQLKKAVGIPKPAQLKPGTEATAMQWALANPTSPAAVEYFRGLDTSKEWSPETANLLRGVAAQTALMQDFIKESQGYRATAEQFPVLNDKGEAVFTGGYMPGSEYDAYMKKLGASAGDEFYKPEFYGAPGTKEKKGFQLVGDVGAAEDFPEWYQKLFKKDYTGARASPEAYRMAEEWMRWNPEAEATKFLQQGIPQYDKGGLFSKEKPTGQYMTPDIPEAEQLYGYKPNADELGAGLDKAKMQDAQAGQNSTKFQTAYYGELIKYYDRGNIPIDVLSQNPEVHLQVAYNEHIQGKGNAELNDALQDTDMVNLVNWTKKLTPDKMPEFSPERIDQVYNEKALADLWNTHIPMYQAEKVKINFVSNVNDVSKFLGLGFEYDPNMLGNLPYENVSGLMDDLNKLNPDEWAKEKSKGLYAIQLELSTKGWNEQGNKIYSGKWDFLYDESLSEEELERARQEFENQQQQEEQQKEQEEETQSWGVFYDVMDSLNLSYQMKEYFSQTAMYYELRRKWEAGDKTQTWQQFLQNYDFEGTWNEKPPYQRGEDFGRYSPRIRVQSY